MQTERIESSQHVKGRMLVFFEDGLCLKITQQELLDFGLRPGDELDEPTMERLQSGASQSKAQMQAAMMIGRKAMSQRDLVRKLQDKGATTAEANYAAQWLQAIGAVDDAAYGATLVRHYAQRGYGESYCREKLREKGIPRELWDEALEHLGDAQEQIAQFLQRRWHGETPDEKERKRTADDLLRRGFSWPEVRLGLSLWQEQEEDC